MLRAFRSGIDSLDVSEEAKIGIKNGVYDTIRSSKAYRDYHTAKAKKTSEAEKEVSREETEKQEAAVKSLSDAFAKLHKARTSALKEKGTPLGDKYADDVTQAARELSAAIAAINNLPVSKEFKRELIEQAKASREASQALNKYKEEQLRQASVSDDTESKGKESRRKEIQKRQEAEVNQLADAIVSLNKAKAKLAKAEYGTAEWDHYAAAVMKAHDAVEEAKDAMVHTGVTKEAISQLIERANATERVAKSEEHLREVQARAETSHQQQAETNASNEQKEAVDALSEALAKVYAIKAKLASTEDGSPLFAEYSRQLEEAEAAVRSTTQAIMDLSNNEEMANNLIEQAKAAEKVAEAENKLKEAEAKKKTPEEQALEAIKEEISLVSQLNDLRKRQASEKSSSARAEYDDNIRDIEKMIDGYHEIWVNIIKNNAELEESEDILRQLIVLEDKIRKGEKDVNKERQKGNALLSAMSKAKEGFLLSVGNAAYRMIEDFVEDKIREFWTNGWEYAQSYYDQLNEIRIVTGQTAEEAERMGKTYRRMAKEMSVSSEDIASAAVEFWRQGLDNSQVNDRLKNTTQYAKISGLEFEEAAELVTAATNSMNLDAQRVVDVFAYLGKQHCPEAA